MSHASTCLRHQVSRHIPKERWAVRAINPNVLSLMAIVPGLWTTARWKMPMALEHLLDNIPYRQGPKEIRREMREYFGMTHFYRLKRKEPVLPWRPVIRTRFAPSIQYQGRGTPLRPVWRKFRLGTLFWYHCMKEKFPSHENKFSCDGKFIFNCWGKNEKFLGYRRNEVSCINCLCWKKTYLCKLDRQSKLKRYCIYGKNKNSQVLQWC